MQTIPGTAASSEDGRLIDRQFDLSRRWMHELDLSGVDAFLRSDLAETWQETRTPNWDGYGATAVSPRTIKQAELLVRRLPLGFPMPTSAAEPDGHITLEWYSNPSRVLSVSVDPAGVLHFAALIGPSQSRGTEPFVDEVPERLLNLIAEVAL